MARRPGSYYEGRTIASWIKGGANLVVLCEKKSLACIADESYERCYEKNGILKKYKYKRQFCTQIKKFQTSDECIENQYKLQYDLRDFDSLCDLKKED